MRMRVRHLIASALTVCSATVAATAETLIIPAETACVGNMQYYDNDHIDSVTFHENSQTTQIGEYSFAGCANLSQIKMPESINSILTGAFAHCISLKELRIPQSVREIPRFMCSGDSSLTKVTLPEGLETIGSHAFEGCRSLTSVSIPQSVKRIGSNAWSGCSSLRNVILPNDLQELESYAFSNCPSLESVRLPANANMLGELLFDDCFSLRRITVPSSIPPAFDCGSPPFQPGSTLYAYCTLFVPEDSLEAYRNATGWKLFQNIKPIKPQN